MVDNGAIGGSQSNPAVSGLATTFSSPSSATTYSSTPPPSIYTVIIGVGPQTFRVTCTGLKPNTLHKAFLLNTDVSGDCSPISPLNPYTPGSPLNTDTTGYLQFDYAFRPQNSPFQNQTAINGQVVAIIPVGNQAFKVSSVDGSSHAESYIISKGTISA